MLSSSVYLATTLSLLVCTMISGAVHAEKIHCNEGGPNSGAVVPQLNTSDVLDIHMYSYTRDDSEQRQPCKCWLTIHITRTAVVLMELQHDGRQVSLGDDAMPYMTAFVTRNGENMTELPRNATNMTYVDVRRGDILHIQLLVDKATAVKMDNLLYLRILVFNTNGTCNDGGPIFCDNNDAFYYIVRNASFVCGAQLNNCALMDNHAAQFGSIGDLQRFARRAANSTGVIGNKLNNSAVLIRNKVHNGALMYQNSLCLWVPIDETNVSLQWKPTNNNSKGPYVALQVTADGRLNLWQLSHGAALKQEVLLRVASRSKDFNTKGGGCKASAKWPPPGEGDGGAGGKPNVLQIVVGIVAPVVAISIGILSILIYPYVRGKLARRSQRANNGVQNEANSRQLEGLLPDATPNSQQPNGANGHQQLGDQGVPNSAPEQQPNGANGHQQLLGD